MSVEFMRTVPDPAVNVPAFTNEPPTASVFVGSVTVPCTTLKFPVVVAPASTKLHDPPEPINMRFVTDVAPKRRVSVPDVVNLSVPDVAANEPPFLLNDPPIAKIPVGIVAVPANNDT